MSIYKSIASPVICNVNPIESVYMDSTVYSSSQNTRLPIYEWTSGSNPMIPILDFFNSRRFQEVDVLVSVDDVMSQLFLSQYLDKSPTFTHTPAQMSLLSVSIPGEVKKSIRIQYEPLIVQALRNFAEIHTSVIQIAADILNEYSAYIPMKSARLVDMIAW